MKVEPINSRSIHLCLPAVSYFSWNKCGQQNNCINTYRRSLCWPEIAIVMLFVVKNLFKTVSLTFAHKYIGTQYSIFFCSTYKWKSFNVSSLYITWDTLLKVIIQSKTTTKPPQSDWKSHFPFFFQLQLPIIFVSFSHKFSLQFTAIFVMWRNTFPSSLFCVHCLTINMNAYASIYK